MWQEIRKWAMSYDPPRKDLPDHLKDDLVHKWRAKTGIELVHKEPTIEEQQRIWDNWNKMDGEMKWISDQQSLMFFGMNNEQHYQKLMKEWLENKNVEE